MATAQVVSRWIELEGFDPHFDDSYRQSVNAFAVEETALLLEMQGASDDVEADAPAPTVGSETEWVPLYVYDATTSAPAAFADRGVARPQIHAWETFSLVALNDRGVRWVRIRATLRAKTPEAAERGWDGRQLHVGGVSLRYLASELR